MTHALGDNHQPRWYLVQTKPRQESVALLNLERQGYRAYLPRTRLNKRRRGKWQSVVEPLFPGYLFVYVEPGRSSLAPVRSTIGARGLVYFGDLPASLDEATVEQIRRHEVAQVDGRGGDLPVIRPGQVVTIIDGPFSGLNGVFQMAKSSDRVMLLIEVLGAPQSVALSAHDIAPLQD